MCGRAAVLAAPPDARACIILTSPRTHARAISMARRGRGSAGATRSKKCRTCSAQSAAHSASRWWSESVSVPPRRIVMKRGSRTFGSIMARSVGHRSMSLRPNCWRRDSSLIPPVRRSVRASRVVRSEIDRSNAYEVSCEPIQCSSTNTTILLPAPRCQENLLDSFTAPLDGLVEAFRNHLRNIQGLIYCFHGRETTHLGWKRIGRYPGVPRRRSKPCGF